MVTISLQRNQKCDIANVLCKLHFPAKFLNCKKHYKKVSFEFKPKRYAYYMWIFSLNIHSDCVNLP